MKFNQLLIIPPLVFGVLVFLWMNASNEEPSTTGQELSIAVRVSPVVSRPISAETIGYGRVTAEQSWSAVAELQGEVAALESGLAIGSIVEKGSIIAQLDRTDYELRLTRAMVNIKDAEAQLAQLEQEAHNLRRSFEIAEGIFAIAEAELTRGQALVASGTRSVATLDALRRALLEQEASLANLANQQSLLPSRRNKIEATLAIRRVEQAEADRALLKTRFIAPFRGQVTEINIQEGQFVRSGDIMLTIESLDVVEVTAEFQPQTLEPLIESQIGAGLVNIATDGIKLLRQAGVEAWVGEPDDPDSQALSAQIVRIRSSISSQTGSLGIMFRVAVPALLNIAVRRGVLSPGSFVAVTLRAAPLEGRISVPRRTVHHDENAQPFLYLVDEENRLQIRSVTLGIPIGDRILIDDGLQVGETILLSNPRPPIPGLLLTPVLDDVATMAAER